MFWYETALVQAENARQLSPECQQWTTRTQRMTYEWEDNNGIRHVTAKVGDRFQNVAIISVIPNMVKAGYRG